MFPLDRSGTHLGTCVWRTTLASAVWLWCPYARIHVGRRSHGSSPRPEAQKHRTRCWVRKPPLQNNRSGGSSSSGSPPSAGKGNKRKSRTPRWGTHDLQVNEPDDAAHSRSSQDGPICKFREGFGNNGNFTAEESTRFAHRCEIQFFLDVSKIQRLNERFTLSRNGQQVCWTCQRCVQALRLPTVARLHVCAACGKSASFVRYRCLSN